MQEFLLRKLGDNNTLIVLCVFTGIFGAMAAIVIKNILHFTISMLDKTCPGPLHSYIYLAFPLVGILLTIFFINRFVKDRISHGVSIAMKAIGKSKGKLRRHNIYSSIVASTLTVGFGGSVGLEAPMVLTGSAIGSNLAQLFHLNRKQTTLLLACGSTAAIAAVFKAPVAAIIFAIEVLMIDFTASAVVPLLVSAGTGTVLSLLFLGKDVMFSISKVEYGMHNIPWYIVLGILCGAVSIYFFRVLRLVDRFFSKIKKVYLRGVVGGVCLGLLIFLFPVFYGEGYENLSSLMQNDFAIAYRNSPLAQISYSNLFMIIVLVLIILLKVVATGVTTSAGGIGGVFAPSLFVGAFTGLLMAFICNEILGFSVVPVNFMLAGMAGVMGGVMHAPVTAIFLIAELSSGYSLLIPLMITAACSYLTVKPIEKHSIYSRQLAEKGVLKTHNKDKFAMKQIDWKNLIDDNILTINISATLREYTKVIAQSKRNIFVVIDDKQLFVGLLVMDDHREMIFRQELYDSVFVRDLMLVPEPVVYDTDTSEEIIRKFKVSGNFNLPVITRDRRYLGFLSKAKMLSAYKDVVAEESED